MRTISNRFFITAIEDGTTLHGSLNATKTLTQAYSGGNAIPDWTSVDEQPIIYLSLFSGSKQVTNVDVGSIKWYCNNSPLVFTGGISQGGIFQTDTYLDSPALKIIKNFATADNVVDTHTVTCSGTYNGIEFSASIQIRVSVVSNNGYFGVLDFKDGKSVFTDDVDEIIINAHLYESGATDELPKGKYSVVWYLNDVEKTGQGNTETDGNYYLKIPASQVTDNAIVRASFLVNNTVVYNTYVSIDDQTDSEYMYIQYNGANGQSATLRKDQSVTFDIWVGKMDNPEAISNYKDFKIKLLDSNGSVYTGNLEGINNADPDDDYWRQLDTSMTFYGGKASITITYDIATQLGKSLTGIIMATELNTDIGGGGLTPQ